MRTIETGQPKDRATLAGVLLHGRNRTPEEMITLADRLGLTDIRWIAPAADNGSWYPNRFMEPIASNEPFLTSAVDRCHEAVQEGREGGRIDAEHCIILGFSQGACLSLEYALRYPDQCRNLIIFTGGLIGPSGTDWLRPSLTLGGVRVLLTGSDIDEWVPESRVRETAKVLSDLGADVRVHVYKNREHVVTDEELNEAREFICQIRPSA
jgi:predicted esterase